MDEAVPALGTGSRCGPYVLVREVGRGGMATVFAAEHVDLKRQVAIKVLRPVRTGSLAGARFAREGRAIARIRHPHVVDVIDIGAADGTPFLVMELVEGPTLATLLHREAPLPLERVASLMLPIASAIHAAHAAGVIHRDLKPSNVLVATDLHGEPLPKVVDFGISKIIDAGETDLTKEHALVGTMAYMAPEQLRSSNAIDDRADQWALGVMLYEAVTGVTPFRGDHAPAVMRAILDGDVEPPSTIARELPRAFDALVMRALSSDPDKRFADVRALGKALLPFASARDWSKWSREFAERATDNVTIDEEVGTAPTDGAMVQTAPVTRGRGALGAFAVASVAAVAAFVWFTRAPVATSTGAPATSVKAAVVPPSPEQVAPVPVAAPLPTPTTIASTTVPPVTPKPPTVATTKAAPPAIVVAAPAKAASATPSAIASAPPAPAPVSPPPPPPPAKPTLGANGAPILE